jgi:hypothetical protein
MKLISTVPNNNGGTKPRRSYIPVLFAAALLAVTVTVYGGFMTARASTGAAQFDNVQVSIQTTAVLPSYSYTVSAYNATGGLVASYQSQYASAAFELPSGAYVFAATAMQQQSGYYTPSVENGASGTTASGGASTAIICCIVGEPAAKGTDACCINNYPAIEYGYASQQVSGPTALNISTKPLNSTSDTTLTIKASYPNGTAASGVYLSGSVLGDVYGWAYGTNSLTLSNTTGASGVATLVEPAVPILVSAETSVPIVLPLNQTVMQVTVAGEKVNVTATWEPTYLSFTGQALLVPPTSGANIVLQYQPQSQGPIPLGIAQTATGVASGAPTGSSAVLQPASQQQASSKSTAEAETQPAASGTDTMLLSGVAVAISVAALGMALFVTRARANGTPK